MKPFIRCALVALGLIALSNSQPSNAFAQGSLTPSGPPAPSMKTLDQVQPRIPISTIPFAIVSPGSYYVTTNLYASTSYYGITILTNDVTIDLNGFSLVGNGAFVPGIVTTINVTNIYIHNGIVRNWGLMALAVYNAYNSRFEKLRISDSLLGMNTANNCQVIDCVFWNAATSGNMSIRVTDGCLIKNCVISQSAGVGIFAGNGDTIESCVINSNAAAIQVGNNCTIQSCSATRCTSTTLIVGNSTLVEDCLVVSNLSLGISAGNSCSFRQCKALGNNGMGFSTGLAATFENCEAEYNVGYGFSTSDNSVARNCRSLGNGNFGMVFGLHARVQDCQSSQNLGRGIQVSTYGQVINCQVNGNAQAGIYVFGSSSVTGCVADNNGYSGIYVYYPDCQVVNNLCDNNNTGDSAGDAGIYIDDSYNRVEGNHVAANTGAGIAVASSYVGNVIIRNDVSGDGSSNYVIPAGNDVGPIGNAATATSPWANISN